MSKTSVIEDAQEVTCAVALIELGARMQVLESELAISRERLIRLYREVKTVSPPRGMLPSSADWYMTWQANIHASLFYNTYAFLKNEACCSHIEALIKGYRLYREHCVHNGLDEQLDLTRAWTLVRFFNGGLLQLTQCCRCAGKFVEHKYELPRVKACAICQPPARAGKKLRSTTPRQTFGRARNLGTVTSLK